MTCSGPSDSSSVIPPPATQIGDPTPAATVLLRIDGMTCGSCARKVTEALEQIPGVSQASIQLESGTAHVTWCPDASRNNSQLTSAVRAAGFRAELLDADPATTPTSHSVLARWRFHVILGAFLTLPLLVGEWLLGLGENPSFKWVGFAFATPVILVCGRNFFVGAWRQLRLGAANMDTLVSLGSSTAYLYSLTALLLGWPGHVYFMEAAAIITLISTGHWLEALANARAGDALRALMNLAPTTARRLLPDGSDSPVPLHTLQRDDLVLLKPGDRIPTDGKVTDGASAVDESMLTGESMPVEKSLGSRLYAGTLNQDGRLVMRVNALGETTALARIIAVVQRAQNSRASIQRLADRVSNCFVPVVVGIAILTGLAWGLAPDWARSLSGALEPFLWPIHTPDSPLAAAVVHATAVLIVACPCAMGLATPAAIMAGTNVAARRGILIRDGEALEKSGTLTAVAFDKTGTLTQGRLTVVADHHCFPGDLAFSLPQATLALTRSSHHPTSTALTQWTTRSAHNTDPLAVYAWQEHRGKGVQAAYSGTTLRLGAVRWLRECGVDFQAANAFLSEWTSQGASIVGLSQDKALLGVFAVRDQPKRDAASIIQGLQQQGLKLFLITGDHRPTALAVARAMGIPEDCVLAEVRPEDKADVLRRLQDEGERVAFVGDGINDAPALEQADLGIAVAQASDVARESADLILLNSDLLAVPEAIGLAQATLRTIKQNLFWAFFYNAAAVPLAALGFLTPVLCALAMGLSDLLVIGNALRLNRWKA